MSYDYQHEKAAIFTEDGLQKLLKLRDCATGLLDKAGAFREQELHQTARVGGDSWTMLACIDFLVERGELRRVYADGARQFNVYVRGAE